MNDPFGIEAIESMFLDLLKILSLGLGIVLMMLTTVATMDCVFFYAKASLGHAS